MAFGEGGGLVGQVVHRVVRRYQELRPVLEVVDPGVLWRNRRDVARVDHAVAERLGQFLERFVGVVVGSVGAGPSGPFAFGEYFLTVDDDQPLIFSDHRMFLPVRSRRSSLGFDGIRRFGCRQVGLLLGDVSTLERQHAEQADKQRHDHAEVGGCPATVLAADQEEEVALPGQPVRGGVDHEAPYGVDTPQEMKSAPWLESTLFIDMTTKRIVWAEESEGCYLPRLINALIELTWPGWTAIWSPEGTHGTLRATGADTDIIYTDHSFKDLGDFDAASDMAPWTISNETDAFSCTTENNKTITWGNYIDLENIALLGPNKMHTLVNKVIQGCNEGKPWQWNLQTHNKQPEKGIHIDYINKTIKW